MQEYFYPKQTLERAQNRPLVQILESIEDFLATGVYSDKTGIAHFEDTADDTLYRSDDAIKNRIEALFNQAISGEFKGKPISIGKLTDAGKAYLEQISGVTFKDYVDFVLNPSDLVHIYKGHFGNNETDERSIPLDIEDIRNIADVVSFPDRIIYAKENTGEKRKMFFFLKEAENGTYNLLEIYADKKGNLTAKTFYKTKEGVSQRAMTLSKSLHTTSETDGATLNDGAKIPQMFEIASVEDDFSAREGVGSYTDDEVSFENDPVSKALGKPRGTRKQRREFAERERRRMAERVEKKRGKKTVIEYKYTDNNGVEYTVITENNKGREEFANFYTNRKASSAARKTRSEEARDTADDASTDKGSNNSSTVQEDDTLFRSDDDVPILNKHRVEEIFGGIWIDDAEEFVKFASAVNNYAFEEDGEGIAYTDNYFYAYYLNIDGQVIPFASVFLNSFESQEVVNQVKQEIKNVRKGERTEFYIDRAYVRAKNLKS